MSKLKIEESESYNNFKTTLLSKSRLSTKRFQGIILDRADKAILDMYPFPYPLEAIKKSKHQSNLKEKRLKPESILISRENMYKKKPMKMFIH